MYYKFEVIVQVFNLLPHSFQNQLLLDRDPHGNVQVARIETERLIMTLIRDEFADWTVLAVAHRLCTISDFDTVVVLNAGQVEEIGNPSELLACGDSAFAALMRS